MENLKEFKELILRYESIMLKEIRSLWTAWHGPDTDERVSFVTNRLTSYGTVTCTLCVAVRRDCHKCVYSIDYHASDIHFCFKGCNSETYLAIEKATTPAELKASFRARAKHMRTILKQIEI